MGSAGAKQAGESKVGRAESAQMADLQAPAGRGNRKLDPDRSDSDRSGSVLSMFGGGMLL